MSIVVVILFVVLYFFIAGKARTTDADKVSRKLSSTNDTGRQYYPPRAAMPLPESASALSPEREGSSVTGYRPVSATSDASSSTFTIYDDAITDNDVSTDEEASSRHYERWRQAIIDSTIINPLSLRD